MKTKIFLVIMSLLFAASSAFAFGEKLIKRGSFIDKFTLQNTDNPAFEGYVVIVLERALYKIIYQTGPANTEMQVSYCNKILRDDDPTCETFDPDPVYAEWDAASQIADGNLTAANRRKWLYAWKYINYDVPELKALKTWLKTQSGFAIAGQHRTYQGGLMTRGWSATDADACSQIVINDDENSCNYDVNTVLHIDGRTKVMVEELEDAIIDLP